MLTDPLAQGTYRSLPGEGHAAKRGPNGRRLCRWCATEVPKGRRTFCGNQQCIHEWRVRRDPGYARHQVYLRDRGVCALCGLDVEAFERALLRWYWASRRFDWPGETQRYTDDEQRLGDHFFHGGSALLRLGFNDEIYGHWQADHIVPVVEGGGACGLEGLRTLCTPCHKQVTRELHARRRARRQAALITRLEVERDITLIDRQPLPLPLPLEVGV